MTLEIARIHAEIDELSAQRAELWKTLSLGRNPDVADRIKRLDADLERLWEAHRAVRARIRFGEREEIVRRARAEERLERAA
jgi:PAS domain-containing protein